MEGDDAKNDGGQRSTRQRLVAELAAGRIRRVLAVRLARLGDVLFTTPALRQLKAAFPELQIDYLTTGYCRDLVAHHPAVDRVLTHDRRWHRPGYRRKRRELVGELKAGEYDVAIVFEGSTSASTILNALLAEAGIRHVIGREALHEEDALVGHDDELAHACQRHSALLALFGAPTDEGSYELHYGREDEQAARTLLRGEGVDLDLPWGLPAEAADLGLVAPGSVADGATRPLLIGLQAGCHYSMWPSWLFWNQRYKYHKTWPYERWAELGQLLADRLGARLVITGAGVERTIGERIADAVFCAPELRPINAAGRTSVGELAALIDQTDLFLSIDTGSMHMASALGVPTLGLYGPTDPRRHGPFRRPENSFVLRSGIDCSPCKKRVRKACPKNRCMTEIHPEAAFAAAIELLQRPLQRTAVRRRAS